MFQPNEYFPALYLSAVKAGVAMMNASLNGVERLQSVQSEAVEEFRAGQADFSKQIAVIHTIQELQAAQAEVARSQIARMGSYWNGLYAAACATQVDLLKEAQASGTAMAQDIGAGFQGAPGGSESVVSALKLVVGAARSTYAATMRATEEMVRMGAAQADAAGMAVGRQGGAKAKRAA